MDTCEGKRPQKDKMVPAATYNGEIIADFSSLYLPAFSTFSLATMHFTTRKIIKAKIPAKHTR
jgi:hypothetical protein